MGVHTQTQGYRFRTQKANPLNSYHERKIISMASSSSSSSSYNSPCAACKFLRRKCLPGCIFAPYFPPEEPQKFANVHKIFGASNVTKLLNDLLPHQREDAVNSLAYEAEARVRDPVYGCVGAISYLQRQVHRLQKELDAANADLIRYATATTAANDHHLPPMQGMGVIPPPPPPPSNNNNTLISTYDHGGFSQLSGVAYPTLLPWGEGIGHHHNHHHHPRGDGGGGDHQQGNM